MKSESINILVKCYLAFCLFVTTTNVQVFATSTFLDVVKCASPLPCLKPSTLQTPLTTTTTPQTPPTSSSKVICQNCAQLDCSMVSNGTTFPYVNHCKLFYQCIDGTAEICVCPNGYWYDRDISKCNLCNLVINCLANKD